MKKTLTAFAALALLIALLPTIGRAQLNSWPLTATLTANGSLATCPAAGCFVVSLSGDPSLSNCVPVVQAGSTFGGGQLTLYTSGDGIAADAQTVSGIADLGNPSSPTSTISAVGSLTVPVAAHASLYAVVSGATNPNIKLAVNCSRGVARLSGSGGGGSSSPAPSPTPYDAWIAATAPTPFDYYPMEETPAPGATSSETMVDKGPGATNGTYYGQTYQGLTFY
jgi:hypothetical protein